MPTRGINTFRAQVVSKLTLQYDGSEFAGWALQPQLRTVQGELERALRTVLGERGEDGEPLTVTVAGRTDRGVHAWGQVVSYRHEALDPLRLNSLLPPDMAVLSCEPAGEAFDARRDAVSRTYCYRVLVRRTRDVFERGRALWWPRALDPSLLPLSAISTSPPMALSARKPWALQMHSAIDSASLRQGIRMVSSHSAAN